ncbi:hypothetical protein PUN28_004627 [Cardiocondyla obscurior]|uniref:Uncharacterized protein n=1 Tax=Cardiocondyla obscurior TaxID=286306 RepID=A0AAW2GBU5_9HYME
MISILFYNNSDLLRNIQHIKTYLMCVSDPKFYMIETEKLSSNGLENTNIMHKNIYFICMPHKKNSYKLCLIVIY